MLPFQERVELTQLNTFGFYSIAERYIKIESVDLLQQLVDHQHHSTDPLLVLGGGSNLILDDEVPGIVAHMRLRGKQLLKVAQDEVLLKVSAGEAWHETVEYAVNQGFYGLENLALIPGTVGAAPIQNIGAYGVELKDRVVSVEVLDIHTNSLHHLTKDQCQFGYRDSLFKSLDPGRYIILSVTFALTRNPTLQLDYLALKEQCEMLAQGVTITPKHVFEAVCAIRQAKLPDPNHLGNVGSFFKNPYVDPSTYAQLMESYPNLVGFVEADKYKLAAGWLIEACGFKGYRSKSVGVYDKQALVLVNYGQGNRAQIEALAGQIYRSVLERFGVALEVEPRYYPALILSE